MAAGMLKKRLLITASIVSFLMKGDLVASNLTPKDEPTLNPSTATQVVSPDLLQDIDMVYRATPWEGIVKHVSYGFLSLDKRLFDRDQMKASGDSFIKALGEKLDKQSPLNINLESDKEMLYVLAGYIESLTPQDPFAGFSQQMIALDLYLRSFLQGHDESLNAIANMEKSTPHATNILGVLYGAGVRVEQDDEKSLKYFQQAFQKGLPQAVNNFAIMQQEYEGQVAPDTEHALRRLRRNPTALYILQDYEGASRLKYPLALAKAGEAMTRDDLRVIRGIEYLGQASEAGHAEATQMLISCYQIGKGVESNPEKVQEYQDLYEQQKNFYQDRVQLELLLINEFSEHIQTAYPLFPWIQSALSKRENNMLEKGVARLNVAESVQFDLNHYGKTLQEILSHKTLNAKDIESITGLLMHNKVGEKLNLFNKGIDDSQFKIIAEGLKENKTVKEINLSKNKLRNNSAGTLLDLKASKPELIINLKKNKVRGIIRLKINDSSLKKLDISGKPLNEEQVQSLADALKYNTILEELNLSSTHLDDRGLRIIAEGLKEHKTVKELGLKENELTNESRKALLELKETRPSLLISLEGNRVDDFTRLELKDHSLVSADLNSKRLTKEEVKSLAESLKTYPSLKELDISYTRLDDKGLGEILEAVKGNKHLALFNLDLSDNAITDKSEKALLELKAVKPNLMITLEGNKVDDFTRLQLDDVSLVSADLRRKSLTEDQVKKLTEVLKKNTTLQQLNLLYNSIGDEGAKMLAEALKVNNKLEDLGLTNNNIGVLGALALTESLKSNRSLNRLDLRINPIQIQGARALLQALTYNKSLGQLCIGDNSLGKWCPPEYTLPTEIEKLIADKNLKNRISTYWMP